MSDVKRPDLSEGRSVLEGGVELYVISCGSSEALLRVLPEIMKDPSLRGQPGSVTDPLVFWSKAQRKAYPPLKTHIIHSAILCPHQAQTVREVVEVCRAEHLALQRTAHHQLPSRIQLWMFDLDACFRQDASKDDLRLGCVWNSERTLGHPLHPIYLLEDAEYLIRGALAWR
jgi:hypothetical protein